jgi:hypothetical protein
MVQTGLA